MLPESHSTIETLTMVASLIQILATAKSTTAINEKFKMPPNETLHIAYNIQITHSWIHWNSFAYANKIIQKNAIAL